MKKVLLLLVCLLLVGCAQQEPAELCEYEEVYLRVSEPYGSTFVVNGNVLQCQINGHTYEFSKDVSPENRDTFINAQEKLCDYLGRQGIHTDGLTFRVVEEYRNRTESAEALAWFDVSTAQTWEQALTTVQASCGDYTNYGWLYALANDIAGELGWTQDSVEDQGTPAKGSLLNLVYPCFSGDYAAEEEIERCKVLAILLLERSGDIWSEEDFLRQRERWAEENGVSYQPTYLVFAYNGSGCPLKFKTRYLEVSRDSTYLHDFDFEKGYIETDYMADVESLIHTYEWMDKQIGSLSERFDLADVPILPVQLTSDAGITANFSVRAYFNVGDDGPFSEAKAIRSLVHEYCHYLYYLAGGPSDEAYESWCNEAMAYYYSMAQDYEDYLLIDRIEPDLVERIEKRIGESFDEPEDYIKLARISIRGRNDRSYGYYLKTSYNLASPFAEYFVRTYGEEAFHESMLRLSEIQNYTGKTLDEIVEDFFADLDDLNMD